MAKAPVRAAAKPKNDCPVQDLNLYAEEVRKPEEQRDGSKFGRTTGLNITQFFNELFYLNYELGLSDPEIEDVCKAEFDTRTSWQTIAAYRGYFNGGKHGFGLYDETAASIQPLGENKLTRFFSEEEEAAKAQARESKKAAKAEAEGEADEQAEPAPARRAAPTKPGPAPGPRAVAGTPAKTGAPVKRAPAPAPAAAPAQRAAPQRAAAPAQPQRAAAPKAAPAKAAPPAAAPARRPAPPKK